MARARGWVRDEVHGRVLEAPTPQEPGTQHLFLDDDSVPELGGSRLDRLSAGRRSESRGASWSRSSTLHLSSRFSTLLCRRR